MSFFVGDSPGPVIVQGLGGPQGPPGPQGGQGPPGSAGSSQLLGSVSAVAISNVSSLAGLAQTFDGVAINAVNMKVLLAGQTDARQNGLYLAQSGTWTRTGDFPSGVSLQGVAVAILPGGTWFGGTIWEMSSATPVTVDTDSHLWNLCSYPMIQGTHANRPAAGTWNKWLRYAETDTLKIYQSDGTTWNLSSSLPLGDYRMHIGVSGSSGFPVSPGNYPINYSAVKYDPKGMFNTGNGRFTAPVGGYYRVGHCARFVGAGNVPILDKFSGGWYYNVPSPSGAPTYWTYDEYSNGITRWRDFKMNTGDYIVPAVWLGGTTTYDVDVSGDSWFFMASLLALT